MSRPSPRRPWQRRCRGHTYASERGPKCAAGGGTKDRLSDEKPGSKGGMAMLPMWFLCAVSSVTVIYLFALAGSGRDDALADSEDFRWPGR